ncbi:MAG: membrane protein insertase YidC [Clostridia bacterium]|nr:membrane protein insertase YidC [Clostridia bacterium]
MKLKTKKITGRIALLTVLVLLVATVLVSCGGGAPTKQITVDGDQFILTAEQMEQHGLEAVQLKKIANMLSAACTAELDTQQMLIAAYRGYDMTLETFSDATVNEDAQDKAARDSGAMLSLEAVQHVITKANDSLKAGHEQKLEGVDITKLNKADVELLINSMKTKIDLTSGGGILDMLLTAIGTVLNWITKYLGFGNYILGICLFAILVEIVMLPFAIKQQKNSIRQAELRPREMAIRAKYAGRTDQVTMQKMQQEIQEFYQQENFNQFSGCLPLLVQLPVIMALYSIVMNPLHYVLGQTNAVESALKAFYSASRAAGGMGGAIGGNTQNTITLLAEIKEQGIGILDGLRSFQYFSNGEELVDSLGTMVEEIPNFTIGGLNFGLTPSLSFSGLNWILLIVPVLTFVSYFLTSKLNRKFMLQPATTSASGEPDRQTACSNSIMDISMPLMSTFFTFMVPALIGVYWVFRSFVSLLKQFIISKVMPLPTFTEEDYKRAAKEMAAKHAEKGPAKKNEPVGNVRSLHYIDDEDFEDTRERGLARKAAIEAREREEREQKAKKNTPVGAEKMKTDDREKREDKKKSSENDTSSEQED